MDNKHRYIVSALLTLCFVSTQGQALTLENETITDTQTIESTDTIIVQNYVVEAPGNLTLEATTEIILKPGFHAKSGSFFHAIISDLDSDGLLDSWELAQFGDITSNSSDSDPDGDGLSNIGEFQAGTNPTAPDSDGDSLPDGWEVQNGLDPLVDFTQNCNPSP